MEFSINYLAVGVSAVAYFVLGAIWFGFIFSKAWIKAAGITEEHMKKGAGPVPYIGTLIADLVTAFCLAHVAQAFHAVDFSGGLQAGAWSWLGFTATTSATNALFAKRPFSLWAINNGYHLVAMLMMGVILTLWKQT